MNSLKIDFQEKPKSKPRIVIGLLMLILSIVYLIVSDHPEGMQWFVIGYGFTFFLLGLSHMAEGSGYSISKFIGEAYLLIDEEQCKYKPYMSKSAQVTNWEDIDSIKFAINHADLIKDDSVIAQLEYSRFTYQQVLDIKSLLNSIAENKGISIN
jgi:hypothetical protein